MWGISNHTGEGAEELRERLVATALDQELMPHVGLVHVGEPFNDPHRFLVHEVTLERVPGEPTPSSMGSRRRYGESGFDCGSSADARPKPGLRGLD